LIESALADARLRVHAPTPLHLPRGPRDRPRARDDGRERRRARARLSTRVDVRFIRVGVDVRRRLASSATGAGRHLCHSRARSGRDRRPGAARERDEFFILRLGDERHARGVGEETRRETRRRRRRRFRSRRRDDDDVRVHDVDEDANVRERRERRQRGRG